MHRRRVRFLDAMNAVGGNDETIVRDVRKSPAVFAGKGDAQHLLRARRLEGVDEIWRFSARAKDHRDVVRRGLEAKLIHVNACEIKVVADRGYGRDIGHERDRGKGETLLDNRMIELDRDMERVAQAAAVAHDEEPAASLETFGEGARHFVEGVGILREEFLLRLHALGALAQHFFAKRLRQPIGRRLDGDAHGLTSERGFAVRDGGRLLQMTPVRVIGRTRAFGRNHRRA